MNLKDRQGLVHFPQDGLEDNETFKMLLEAGYSMTLLTKCGGSVNAVVLVEEVVTCLKCLAKS